MHTVMERELELSLVLSPEHSIPVPARFSYRTDDPYAVHVTFHLGSDHPVHWTFARELLVEGVFRPCGYGDVRVWPTRVRDRRVVLMALSSPNGDALLEAPAEVVSGLAGADADGGAAGCRVRAARHRRRARRAAGRRAGRRPAGDRPLAVGRPRGR